LGKDKLVGLQFHLTLSCKGLEIHIFKTKLCKGNIASNERQVYEKHYRESSQLEEKDLLFPSQEMYIYK
jgi:hypothetical protein